MTETIKVRIVGDHPWQDITGTLVATMKPLGILPVMGKVVFDSEQETHGVESCFAESKNLIRIS